MSRASVGTRAISLDSGTSAQSIGRAGGRRLPGMEPRDRSVRLHRDAYDVLVSEAGRRGVEPDALADELVRAVLAPGARGDLDAALDALAEFRADLPRIDVVALVRAGRDRPVARGV